MRSSLSFFRLFPPPKLMLMPHAGLDISDDGMSCIAYSGFGGARHISTFGRADFPPGLYVGGDIADEKDFIARLSKFGQEHNLTDVKISVPEEKAYLFQTEVPSTDQKTIEQNIEFKLEENVPLAAVDAVFYFDLLPRSATGGALRASVSVVPRTYIEHYMALITNAGLRPVSFETTPKAIARSVVPVGSDKTRMLVHMMNRKTGVYIVSGNVIHFTFTSPWGSSSLGPGLEFSSEADLFKEIERIRAYWMSHGNGMRIEEAVFVGKDAEKVESAFSTSGTKDLMAVKIADIWHNAINLEKYLPAISMADSLGYAVAAGLGFDTPRSA